MAMKKRLYRDMAVGGATAAPAQAPTSTPTAAPAPTPTSAKDSGEVLKEQTKALEAKNKAANAAEDLEKAKAEGAIADASAATAVTVGSCFGPWGTLIGGVVAGGIEVTKAFTIDKDIKAAEAKYAEATAAAAKAAANAKAAAEKIEAANDAKNAPAPAEEVPTVEASTAAKGSVEASDAAISVSASGGNASTPAPASAPVSTSTPAPAPVAAPGP